MGKQLATESQLVVLPYREMHNSGSVLAGLSLDRPVLVPDNDVNRALSLEVGPDWVLTYAGELDGAVLKEALDQPRPTGSPDLSARGWDRVSKDHVEAYRQARRAAGRGKA